MQKNFLFLFAILLGITLTTTPVVINGQAADCLNHTLDVPANKSTPTFLERRLTNALDIIILSIAAKVINDYCLYHFHQGAADLPLPLCLAVGFVGWAAGEGAEMIYKKVYEHITHNKLRETLGIIKIGSIEIDNQRLLRRIISLLAIFIPLYINQQAFTHYMEMVNEPLMNPSVAQDPL